ncbi:hypothetical protein EV699_106212, partial [Plasticicumulans lactativorans]
AGGSTAAVQEADYSGLLQRDWLVLANHAELSNRYLLIASAGLLPIQINAETDPCMEFVKNPIVTKIGYEQHLKTADAFKQMQCSANWMSASDALNAGIEATVPIYSLPTPITVSWDNSKVEQWKSNNCSKEERSSSYTGSLLNSFYEENPISARVALECIIRRDDKKAVRCSVDDGENAIAFNAEWRRTYGEPPEAAPKITDMSYRNANCYNNNVFSRGTSVLDGGIALLCERGDKQPVFVLSTDRGACIEFGMDHSDVYTLSGIMELSSPLFVRAARVQIKSDLKMITNGNNVQIYANDRLDIQGAPTIVSYRSSKIEQQSKPGGASGIIIIKAKKINGGNLTINNAGQDGGRGIDGEAGPPGTDGGPGRGRDPITGSSHNLFGYLIEIIPKGCTGGRPGGNGERGHRGQDGTRGAPGGSAGEVTLMLPLDVTPGEYISVLTGVDLNNQARLDCAREICGGKGGDGGQGGLGGAGGRAGKGANATALCPSTIDGVPGAVGESGAHGASGPTGAHAEVRYK